MATSGRDGTDHARRFLQLAGHPLRWRLLRELARSDRRVGELTGLVGEPQNLVSYHLGQLRAGRLVSARRSSADGRDLYYTVDLARFGDLLALTGQALHPGLRLAAPGAAPGAAPAAEPYPAAAGGTVPRLLFLCTGNSGRSQLAEALARVRSGSRVEAFSAGSRPKPLHPNAVRVMAEAGIDLSAHRSKHLSVYAADAFDYVITLCDKVREVCPEFPGHPGYVHWSIPDPAAAGDSDEQTYPAFQQLAAGLETRIGYLLAGLADPPGLAAPAGASTS
ncbi:MAG: ArsR family transcriptional regulator [Actinobacteria bacterium]|nr:ArsR family transcriptional regulator [Actinomycetota bacterium]